MDLINRNKAARQLHEVYDDMQYELVYEDGETLANEVENILASLPQENQWILVSERLPEDSGEYLVSVIDENCEYEAVGVAWFAHKKDYGIKESEWRKLEIGETVVAWMPLPEPYKAESDKEGDNNDT